MATFSDTFTESIATDPQNHTADSGHGWDDVERGFDVGAGTGLLTQVDQNKQAAIANPTSADYMASITGRTGGSDRFGVMVRYGGEADGAENGYLALIRGSTGNVDLYEVTDGTATQMGLSENISGFSATTDFKLSLEVTGANPLTIRTLMDDVELHNVQEDPTTHTVAGQPGIYLRGAGQATLFEATNAEDIGDTTNPTLSSTTPADDATAVAITINPTATFSEDIQFGTGNITLKVAGGANVEVFDVTTNIGGGPGTVSITGNTLTIEPTSDLSAGTDYAIQIDATAIEDLASNAFAGIADDTTWNFRTVATRTGTGALQAQAASISGSGTLTEILRATLTLKDVTGATTRTSLSGIEYRLRESVTGAVTDDSASQGTLTSDGNGDITLEWTGGGLSAGQSGYFEIWHAPNGFYANGFVQVS